MNPSLPVRALMTMALFLAYALPATAARPDPQSVDAAWIAAMKANDVEAVVKCYATDAVVWFPGTAQARGTEAIRAMLAGMLAANRVKDVVLSDTTYKTMGNAAAGWGKFELTLAPKDGSAPVVMSGRWTVVSERRGNDWVYVVDHASAEPEKTQAATQP